jgi:hypothetical protein
MQRRGVFIWPKPSSFYLEGGNRNHDYDRQTSDRRQKRDALAVDVGVVQMLLLTIDRSRWVHFSN